MKNKSVVKTKTISYAYVTHHNTANYALQTAKMSVDGRFFNMLTAMVFSAFSLEAYLNHIGQSELPNWEKIEREMSPRQKLDKLTANRGYSLNFSSPPFNTFDKIFFFRNKIAHGKTERLEIEEIQVRELGDEPRYPRTSWETETNLENATLFIENSASIIRLLHPIFGYRTDAFFTEWESSWEAKPYDDCS